MAGISTSDKLDLAVFISGSGSNLQALIDACRDPDFPARIAVVFSNKEDAYGLTRAKSAGISTETLSHKGFSSREEYDAAAVSIIKRYDPDLICLAGFMRILTPVFITPFAGRIINTHPSLLPRHGGEGMFGHHVHEAVLAAGDSESGPSIHFVTAEVDRGPVILQRRVPVLPDDTPDTLAARVLAEEHKAYPDAVRMIAEGKVSFTAN
ncbi:MAG: phosphoribosylglycinamide formyltransferase [Alphaproteobacteria bacterium]|nr:phosphoribosylglycinamide formyltransferase [Alphaproteobacteria bacterium]MCD8520213.1 phosphoribosylglycinamide formyltransferase [Alphaproteobacteria bacterium]MCD8570976.1 phosphoribosylglycinamide formyltransferase [Alphaproteobacteria bacterium]